MFPYPSGDGPPRRAPARLHRHRRLRALHAHERPQRAPRDGLRRLRAPRRAVRGADRPAPPGHDRGEHRQHAPPAAGARARPRPAPRASPPPTSPTTAGRSGSSCRSSTPGTTTTPDRARPIAELVAEFEAGTRAPESDANPDELAVGRARRRRAPRGRRLVPARVPRRGDRQLVPGARHRARQRRGHRRRPQRARQPSRCSGAR